MGAIASQITRLTIVYSIVYSDAENIKEIIKAPRTGEFPAQMASYAENVSIRWRHHDLPLSERKDVGQLFACQNKFYGTEICVFVVDSVSIERTYHVLRNYLHFTKNG